MTKNIQNREISKDYETLIYVSVILPLIGIVIASIIRSVGVI